MADFTPTRRDQLAKALRAAADKAYQDPALAKALLGAVRAVEAKDARRLEEVLAELRAAGYRPIEAVPGHLLAAAGIGGGEAGGTGGGTDIATRPAPTQPSWGSAGPAYVSVYDPDYAERVRSATQPAPDAAKARPEFIPYQTQWQRARIRANDALTRGGMPIEYRPLVRAFFDVE